MSTLLVENLKGPTTGSNANKVIVPSGQTLDAGAGTFTPSAGQYVQNIIGSRFTTNTAANTTSYVDIISLSITPKHNDSLVKVMFHYHAGGSHTIRLLRGSTVVFQPTNSYLVYGGFEYSNQTAYNSSSNRRVQAMAYIDNPATTSATIYKWQLAAYPAANGSGAGFNELTATSGSSYSYMELLEIKQ
jgi:hypothetical protein